MMQATLFLLFVSAGFVTSDEGDNRVPNIEYVLRGYNILKGNPLSTGGSYDPGFQEYIFKRTYENQGSDRKGIPDHVNVAVTQSCNYDYSSDTMASMSEYQSSLMVKASVEGEGTFGVVEAAFSLSAEYNKMRKDIETSSRTVIKAEASCKAYDAFLQSGTPPKLSDNFVAYAKRLAETRDYQNFLNSFGTHYVTEVQMGVRYTSLKEISKESKEEMQDEGIDVQMAASASAFGKSGEASSEVKYDEKKTEKFERAVERTIISTVGGRPYVEDDALKWIVEKRANPLPLSYKLRSILTLFQSHYFRDVDINLSAIRDGLDEHLKVYCSKSKPINFKDAECHGPPRNCAGGNRCSVHAKCTNGGTDGRGYRCECNEGYNGNGEKCTRDRKWVPAEVIEHQSTKGPWGTWGEMDHCAKGVIASGFLLKAEGDQGSDGDDTAGNAVCIKCGNADKCSKKGSWGDWSDAKMCPKGHYLTGWRQNVEEDQGDGDDTALNNVEYRCRDLETWEKVHEIKVQAKEWGKWSRWMECPEGEFVCGIQTRVEEPTSGDDTALNDIKHQCCKTLHTSRRSNIFNRDMKDRTPGKMKRKN